MFDIKITCKNKEFHWYDNVKTFVSNEDILAIEWWSTANQEYLYTIYNQSDIKKIKIKNKELTTFNFYDIIKKNKRGNKND